MQLYLVRHGEAVSSSIDKEQPLSPLGTKQVETLCEVLQDSLLYVEEILHSPKKRAKQTAELLARGLKLQCPLLERDDLMPMDPIESILHELRSAERNLMIVGHLPFMDRLLSSLLLGNEDNNFFNFTGSSMVALENVSGTWRIIWALSPSLYGK